MSQWIKILNAGRNICSPLSSSCFKIINAGINICSPNQSNCIKINNVRNKLDVPQPFISDISNTSFTSYILPIPGATRYHFQLALDSNFSQIEREIYLPQEPDEIGGATTGLTPGVLYFMRIRAEDTINNRFSDYSFNSIQLLS